MTDPVRPLAFENDIPDLNIDDVRADFFEIWQKNVAIVRQVRRSVNEAGNYGSEEEKTEPIIDKELRINIQGAGTDSYTREKWGIDTTSKSWKCYVLWDEDLKNNDRITWNGVRFIIQNLNQATYAGQRVFWEFGLKGIDKDVGSFND